MRSPVLFMMLACVSVVLAVIHHLALTFFLYWTYPWFDIPMHFLGGVALGMLFLVLLFAHSALSRWQTLAGALVFVAFVGMVWEFFEVIAGISTFEMAYIPDTILDMIMDLIGGAVGYLIGKRMLEL